ncbi:hypothetical protein [Methanocaldococcus sp.]|uniref:hypothetical protein n=1 Tax=Methanocaldococcus sp. TaxID=2152917 RepID=UPI00261279CE|nr:hypothetical protein [Methanocaldococcus sp.]MCQ6253909.1 hypothetical protein [Methanocaldococcus sp.]
MDINEMQNKKLKNKRLGLIIGSIIWFGILFLSVIVSFYLLIIQFKCTDEISYLLYVITTLLFSTCILIGIYWFNEGNPILKKLLKIDGTFLIVGIIIAIFEIILNQPYHHYNEYLPLTIYMIRLMLVYMSIDELVLY